MTSNRLLNVATGLMVACALTITGLVIRRELFATPGRRPTSVPRTPERVANWKEIAAAGTRMGPADAPVIITEFSDFQCPYCRRLAPVLKEIQGRYPGRVAISYRHFPIARHPFAATAAQASECAGAQERFEAYHDALFDTADSIGKRPWIEFAAIAGVRDMKAFQKCLSDSTYKQRVEADQAVGKELRLVGTPTIIVNEWRWHGAPTTAALDSLVKSQLDRPSRR